MQTRRIKTADLIPSLNREFVDVGLLALFDKLAWGDPLILKGPKGVGKTINVEEWAARKGVPFIREDCNSGTDETQLIGSYGMEGDTTFFTLGVLTTVIEAANDCGEAVLALEEINTLRPQVQSMIFSLTDHRKTVEATSLGKKFRLDSESRLWVVGTMNPNYAGTYSLNEALRSRFNFVEVGYMDRPNEMKILEGVFPSPVQATERSLCNRLLTFAEESRTGEWNYALSTRDLVYAARMFKSVGVDGSLAILTNKFDPDHQDALFARIQSIFGVNLTGVRIYG